MSITIFTLCVVTILFAYYSLEAEDRLHSVVSLGLTTISKGAIFMYIGAIYVAVFHLVVYSGVMTVLFAAVAHFMPETEIMNEEITIKEDENED